MNEEFMPDTLNAANAGTVSFGEGLTANRLGLGTNRTEDTETSRAVLQRAVELGIQLIDTADVYTKSVSESTIAKALHPYPEDLVIASKGGIVTEGQDTSYDYLSEALERSRERLQKQAIDLYYVHRLDGVTPIAETAQFLREALEAGTIRAAALSNVSVDEIDAFRELVPIAAVQNQYSVLERKHEDVLDYAEQNGIVFVPYQPLKAGATEEHKAALEQIGANYGLGFAQISLAWLLKRSAAIAPIPGTQSIAHLEGNVRATSIELSDEDYKTLDGLARP
jgi:aryl-alcohol dehydrogenase-like predicted oxidoreductase